jgi:hypothetical protein
VVAYFILTKLERRRIEGQVDKVFKNFFGFEPQNLHLGDFSVDAQKRVKRLIQMEASELLRAYEAKDSLVTAIGRITKAFIPIVRYLNKRRDNLFDAYDAATYRGYLGAISERSLAVLASL